MATATVARRDLKVRDQTFLWEGVDRNNKPLRGELRAVSETVATTNLRRQGIRASDGGAPDSPPQAASLHPFPRRAMPPAAVPPSLHVRFVGAAVGSGGRDQG